jgi:hypothetical protein
VGVGREFAPKRNPGRGPREICGEAATARELGAPGERRCCATRVKSAARKASAQDAAVSARCHIASRSGISLLHCTRGEDPRRDAPVRSRPHRHRCGARPASPSYSRQTAEHDRSRILVLSSVIPLQYPQRLPLPSWPGSGEASAAVLARKRRRDSHPSPSRWFPAARPAARPADPLGAAADRPRGASARDGAVPAPCGRPAQAHRADPGDRRSRSHGHRSENSARWIEA